MPFRWSKEAVCLLIAAIVLVGCSGRSDTNSNPDARSPSSDRPAEKKERLRVPAKFLLVGDSLMIEGFGPEMEKALLQRTGFSAVRNGVYSTGLNRSDFFDWTAKTEELVGINKPDAIIVMFGANDGQGIVDGEGKSHQLGTDAWSATYAKKVNEYLTRISPLVKKIYWVGHPMPGNDSFLKKVRAMNPVYEAESARFPNVSYVNTWDRFSPDGKLYRTLPDDTGKSGELRGRDGIHVTTFGGKLMAGVVLKAIERDLAEDAK